jgi:Ca2+-binding RTX toxin-like protein
LLGGAGDDDIIAGYNDIIDGGDGSFDNLSISFVGAPAGVTITFSSLGTSTPIVNGSGFIRGIESLFDVRGSNFDDAITIGSFYNGSPFLLGLGGNDRLVSSTNLQLMAGGDGNDTLDGSGAFFMSTMVGEAGDDLIRTAQNSTQVVEGGAGADTITGSAFRTFGGSGNDTITLNAFQFSQLVHGDDGDDFIDASGSVLGGAGADTISGGSAADLIGSADGNLADFFNATASADSGSERDVISGRGGNDMISAGFGDDVDGGDGEDRLSLSLAGGTAGLTFSTAGMNGATGTVIGGGTIRNVETLASLTATNFDDDITVATQATLLVLDAGAGNDTIRSGGSSVQVSGGTGDDRFVSGVAGDVFDGGAGVDTIDYSALTVGVTVTLANAGNGTGAGGDSLTNVENADGSAFNDALTGNNGANLLKGLGGADTLAGGTGDDTLDGGAGDDILVVDDTGDRIVEECWFGRPTTS